MGSATIRSKDAFAAIADAVGADGVAEATSADAVDGVVPRSVVSPSSLEQAAAVLRAASDAGLGVVCRGSGTKLGWGNAPERCDLILSSARMDRVLEHAAGDLVVRAEAGVRLAALQGQLAGSGQMLALDPPEAGATLGGVVAAAASGPRRLRYGTARDLLIGVTVVLSDGTVARAGGKVVKNVAGYDLMKLFTGSFGTLGFVAEVTFRLHPLPTAERSVGVRAETPVAAQAAVEAMSAPSLVPSSIELWRKPGDGGAVLSARYEGFEPGVIAQQDHAVDLLRGIGDVALNRARYESDPAGAPTVVKLTHPPARLAATLEAIASSAPGGASVSAHAAVGVTFVGIASDDTAEQRAAIDRLRAFAVAEGGAAVVLRASPDLKRQIDVWGPADDTLDLMRRVKDRFDPSRTMSPGRFVGGI